mgnify:CR=1 FL=1
MGGEYINALAELNINDKNAPLEVIKSKFKDIVKQLHPDTVGYKEENIEKLDNQNAKGVLHIATHGFAFEDARGTSATIDHQSIIYNLQDDNFLRKFTKEPLLLKSLTLDKEIKFIQKILNYF